MSIDIGIAEADRKAIADGLASYLLTPTLCTLRPTITTGTSPTVIQHPAPDVRNTVHGTGDGGGRDSRAYSRIGFPGPGSYRAYAKLTEIEEKDGVPSAEDMIRHLVVGQETVVRTARALFPVVGAADDQPTADLLTQRMQIHEKNAWMLRSMLVKQPEQ